MFLSVFQSSSAKGTLYWRKRIWLEEWRAEREDLKSGSREGALDVPLPQIRGRVDGANEPVSERPWIVVTLTLTGESGPPWCTPLTDFRLEERLTSSSLPHPFSLSLSYQPLRGNNWEGMSASPGIEKIPTLPSWCSDLTHKKSFYWWLPNWYFALMYIYFVNSS